jgi:YHS domain-containing protein
LEITKKSLTNLYNCQVLYLFILIDFRNIMFKDPVCNMMVDEKKAKFISEAKGEKVYLCSAMCKSEFESDPSKYGY